MILSFEVHTIDMRCNMAKLSGRWTRRIAMEWNEARRMCECSVRTLASATLFEN